MLQNTSIGRDLVIAMAARPSRSRELIAIKSIAEALAAAFVDVARIAFVAVSDEVRGTNVDRYKEFMAWALNHLADVETQLSRFTALLDDHTLESGRFAEKRIAFLIRKLQGADYTPPPARFIFAEAWKTAEAVHMLCLKAPAPLYLETRTFIEQLFAETHVAAWDFSKSSVDAVARLRFKMQNAAIRHLGEYFQIDVATIADDLDLTLAILYFSIDHLLLERLVPARS